MFLIMIRHAERQNLPDVTDAAQVLTPKGQDDARKVGQYLATLDLPTKLVFYSSDYIRAVQTAELVNKELGNKYSIQTLAYLRPEAEGSIADILELIKNNAGQKYVIIVGHQPELERLGEYFTGRALTLKKAETVCLDIKDKTGWHGKVAWRYLP